MTLAAAVDYVGHRSYIRDVHLKRKLKYNEQVDILYSYIARTNGQAAKG